MPLPKRRSRRGSNPRSGASYLAAFVVVVVMVAWSPALASATLSSGGVLCNTTPSSHICPDANVYEAGTTVKATLSGSATFKNAGGTLITSCTGGVLNWSVTNAGSATSPVKVKATAYSFSGCASETSFSALGEAEIRWEEGTNQGSASQFGNRMTVKLFGESCTYQISGPTQVSGTTLTEENAKVELVSGVGCPAVMYLTASYQVTAPSPLSVQRQKSGTILCSSLEEPCASAKRYAAGTSLKAALKSGSVFGIRTPSGYEYIKCSSASLQGSITNGGASGVSATADISTPSFGECISGETAGPTTVVAENLPWHAVFKRGAGGSGILTITDVRFTTSGSEGLGTCTYAGSVSFTLKGGSEAELTGKTGLLPRVSGSEFFCYSSVSLSTSMLFSSPKPLFLT